MCHAKDGKGNPAIKGMVGGDMSKLDLTDDTKNLSEAALSAIIRDSRNKMPAYKGKLTDVQICAIVKYIKSL